MFKYLRMDAYRLIKTKTLYVALGIILAAVAFSVYMIFPVMLLHHKLTQYLKIFSLTR